MSHLVGEAGQQKRPRSPVRPFHLVASASSMDPEAGPPRSPFPRTKPARNSAFKGRLTTSHTLLASSFLLCFFMLWQSSGQFQLTLTRTNTRLADTVVVYVYSNTDPEYEANLVYFLEKGVKADDGCDYVIIIQEGPDVAETHALPDTPSNVRFVRHVNECYDWGTFGWALETGVVDPSRYRYLILLNSSVRGPFLPPYWPPYLHWSDALTSRITDEVKMVGSTISCEGSWKGGVLTGEKRQNPHVQSYVVAMDQTALRLIEEDPTVLKCYKQYHDAVWFAEMGSSAAILRAGYNIDALMMRYQGVDWRQTENWGCNAALNPYAEHMYDGIDLSPFEIMFVKLKEFLLEANWTTATQGKKYSQWNMHQDDIRQNEYNAKKDNLRLIKIMGMRVRGNECFDYDLYRRRNPDLPKWGKEQLWEHFVKHGQHEGRVFRFSCPAPQRPSALAISLLNEATAAAAAAAAPGTPAGDGGTLSAAAGNRPPDGGAAGTGAEANSTVLPSPSVSSRQGALLQQVAQQGASVPQQDAAGSEREQQGTAAAEREQQSSSSTQQPQQSGGGVAQLAATQQASSLPFQEQPGDNTTSKAEAASTAAAQ